MDALVARYHGRLLDFALRHLRDREAAADVAQTTLVNAFEAIGRFRANASFRTWIYAIALNLIRDVCRRRQSRNELLESEAFDGESGVAAVLETADPGPSPERAAIDEDVSSTVWAAVDGLSDGQRSAVILRFRQGFTYEEIAETMQVPVGTVKSWIHHAMRKLRTALVSMECEV